MNDCEQRQLLLMKEVLEKIKNTNIPEVLNAYLNNLYVLLSFLEKYKELHQKLLENWGTLEVINAVMLAESREVMVPEEANLRLEALEQLEKLVNDKLDSFESDV